jgi:hypothetical protein
MTGNTATTPESRELAVSLAGFARDLTSFAELPRSLQFRVPIGWSAIWTELKNGGSIWLPCLGSNPQSFARFAGKT